MFWLALLTFFIWLLGVPMLALGIRSLKHVRTLPLPQGTTLPPLSVVVAARDEVKGVEHALTSLLSLDYPDVEVIVVDDRSTDGTGEVLDRMARTQPRLHVIHNRELPARWLGKNHALQLGARHSSGELILFTDADIVFEPSTLRRAAAYLQQHQLDHLAVSPDVRMQGYWAQALFGFFSLAFSIWTRPWRVRNPKARESIGIGAFNLVRRAAYDAIGGHAQIAMRPDDDLQLGRTLKRAGFRQDFLIGTNAVMVEWYPNVRAMIVGLEKNAFAAFNYSTLRLAGALIMQQIVNTLPWIALLLTSGVTWWLNVATCVLTVLAWLAHHPAGPRDLKYAIAHPLLSLIFTYIILRAAVLTLWRGGIRWRDTFYTIEELKAR